MVCPSALMEGLYVLYVRRRCVTSDAKMRLVSRTRPDGGACNGDFPEAEGMSNLIGNVLSLQRDGA